MSNFSHLAPLIDYTALSPSLLLSDIDKICDEAVTFGFASVCIPPLMVGYAKKKLGKSNVKVAAAIGFPFGYSAIEAKLSEAILAIVDGADELDMVINYTAIKNEDWGYLANEINHIAPPVLQQGRTLKLILEADVLNDDEIIKCCQLYAPTGVQFLNTSTGYAGKGDTIHAVQLMRRHLSDHLQIKAGGGIRTPEFAQALIDAGATRLGCSNLAVMGMAVATTVS